MRLHVAEGVLVYMCMQSPCRVETHVSCWPRCVPWECIILRPMRITFALCAWALLLAAPRVHGLRPRDPAKLLAGPQAMRWRSDRDRATRATVSAVSGENYLRKNGCEYHINT